MTNPSITASRRIPAPPERVWRAISNVEDSAQNLTSVSAIEMLTEPPFTVGSRWRETRRVVGTEAVAEKWVREVEPRRRAVIVSESSAAEYATTFTLEPDGEGTLLVIELAGIGLTGARWHTLLWRLFGLGGIAAARRSLRRDLDDIAAAASALAP